MSAVAERRAAASRARQDDKSEDTQDATAPASQTARTQLRLRELIVGGELRPGQRIAELTLVERLGASRTPVRMALVRLQEEGLLDALPNGGFVVKDFSEADIRDAIEVRGTLEGMAARYAAERGVTSLVLADARDALDRIDALLAKPRLSDASFESYVVLNGRFHALIVEMAGSHLLARQIERAVTLPFASPSSFVLAQASGEHARDMLVVAQQQHRSVLDAIQQRAGARAEALMREHALIAHRNLREALQNQQTLQRVPGASLIRRRAPR